jgi:hypothetical protein
MPATMQNEPVYLHSYIACFPCHSRPPRDRLITYGANLLQEERQRVVSNMRILRFDNAVKSLGPATERQLFHSQGYKE